MNYGEHYKRETLTERNMKKELSVDLSISRKDSGLSQQDAAHLLGVSKTRISRLQNGKAKLSAAELTALCLIYGRSAEQLLRLTTRTIRQQLHKRLSNMPSEPAKWERLHTKRLDTLNSLYHRLGILKKEVDE